MNNNYENLPAVLNANQLAAALGISRAKDKLIDWIEQNTGGGNGN